MNDLLIFMFLERVLYGGIVEYHGFEETTRWYIWVDEMRRKHNAAKTQS